MLFGCNSGLRNKTIGIKQINSITATGSFARANLNFTILYPFGKQKWIHQKFCILCILSIQKFSLLSENTARFVKENTLQVHL